MAYVPTYHDLAVTYNTTWNNSSSASNATVHYIEAGSTHLPNLVLWHGFPASSAQYDDFIPMLADRYHVLAPDLPGFGLTQVDDGFEWTFDNLAAVTGSWLETLGLESYAFYIFDYGAPVALRLAVQNPAKVQAIISQNGNAYVDGFGQDFWAPIFALWNSSDSAAARQQVQDEVLTLAATKSQYTAGTPTANLPLLNAQAWHIDYFQNIAGASNTSAQLDLFYDYRNNVKLYPQFQEYFRTSGVPILAVWGANDPAFIPAGAESFKKDSPDAVVRFVDAGHFALESQRWEIARIARQWLTGIGF